MSQRKPRSFMPLRILAVFISVACMNVLARSEEVDYSGDLPRVAATEPASAMATFTVAEPFELQMVASEPLVGSPVSIEWGEDGAMYVCEMRGYSEDQENSISRIARLTDRDGDGVYDHRTEFAQGLRWPTAIFPFDGGLFVGDAPDILYYEDHDGDGVADTNVRVFTGFGTSNVQGLLNSFRWGLDHRIHVACSSAGGDVRRVNAKQGEQAISVRGRDFAFDPRSHAFRLTSGAAQHGMSFDDWGRKFVSSNSDHIQQVMYEDADVARNPFLAPPPARISIAEDGPQAEVYRKSPVEPWRELRTRLRVAGLAKGPIEGGGRAAGYFTGATGITIYRGDAWPPEHRGLAIVGDVGGNLVHRKSLVAKGLEFVAKRIDVGSEFVASTDIWFRPAQFANAPDGSLHVIDMYREVIEHPLSLPAEIKRHLDLTSGRDRGRIYRIVPKGYRHRPTPDLGRALTSTLVEMLAHNNAWHRETAARLLFERQDSAAVKQLRQVVQRSPSSLARLHALYSLDGMRALDQLSLRQGLRDPHPQVRRHALRLLQTQNGLPEIDNTELNRTAAGMTEDPSIEVRYQLGFMIGTIADDSLRRQVLRRLVERDGEDRWMAVSILSSVRDDAAVLLAELASEDSALGSNGQSLITQLTQMAERQSHTSSESSTDTGEPARELGEMVATPARRDREKIVESYAAALTLAGDTARGRMHFTKHCSVCHQPDGSGQTLGPSVDSLKSKGASVLLTSILDPNREVNPQYLNHVLVLHDGRVTSGMIADEGANSVTLRRADGMVETVLRIDIEAMQGTGLSIMPEGFEQSLDAQAMADLLAYLLDAR